ncbi:MAG: AEC family transporter [Paracoccaceae bacterium]|nr:AEC family transporter [Paracoccaceae bacterium]MDP7185110.1 AEC family transporter [Paracoccaceae bacterium]
MNLLATVLQIVAPVFLLAGIGFAWVKAGFDYPTEFVTKLSMTFALPCLIFVSLMQTEIDPTALTALALASIAAYAVLAVVFWTGIKLAGMRTDVFVAPMIFGNTGNLGLPLALFAFGQIGLSYAVVILAVMSVMAFSFGIWLVSGGGSLWKVVKEPIVAATLLGALFLWQGWETPEFLTNSIQLAGQMAIPLMLITLGVAVARLSPEHMAKATIISAVKLVVSVAVATGVAQFFVLDQIAYAVLVVQVATPIAVTSYLVAQKYGAEAETVAGLVVASTLLSVGYLPLLLVFLLP